MALKDSSPSSLDFQSAKDDAWYSVNLVLQGETLIVKFCNFSDDEDERYIAADYEDPKDLEDFILRFRPTSLQLQDYECRKVIEGIKVCAAFEFDKEDVRFYDAVVEEVNFKDHKHGKEEVCTCTFVLFWLSGPNEGEKTQAVVAHICLPQPGNALMDRTLSSFVEICRKRNKVAKQHSGRAFEVDNDENSRSLQFGSPARLPREVKTYKHSVSKARKYEGRITDHCEGTEQDKNLGGKFDFMDDLSETSSFHYVLIENLEKELSPSAIVNFVKKYVGVTCQAQVFLSLSFELYTRGIILVDSQGELQKLSVFLHNPAHMILSSWGRPWVIAEKGFCPGAVGVKVGDIAVLPESRQSRPWDECLEIDGKIKIVRSGTEEYERGKRLKDLFLGFADHQQGLHKQLALAESKILQPSIIPGKRL